MTDVPQLHACIAALCCQQQGHAMMRKVKSNPTNNADKAQPEHLQPNAAEWLAENRAALLAYNAWITENGLPLDEFR